MPRKASSAHDELARLREHAAAERVKARTIEAQLEEAQDRAQRADRAITVAYSVEDAAAGRAARRELQDAETEADDLGHRAAAAQIRVAAAQGEVDCYLEAHATALLGEREADAEQITTRLTTAVAEALKQHRALLAERQAMDRLVAAAGGEPRLDGPPAAHEWESALLALERQVAQHPQIVAPRPRWLGRGQQAERDRTHRLLRARREGNQQVVDEFFAA